MSGLTNKQSRFVEEYLVDLNATQAAIRAGYSQKTADVIGCENLGKPKIAEAVAEAMEERSERTEITQDMVIAGLLAEARHEGDGSGDSRARTKAWELLGKHLAMFTDKVQAEGELPVLVVRREDD